MITQAVNIINRLGLHARAAACFVKLASNYKSEIFLIYGDQRVNGKSIMGIMMLAASKGTALQLEAEGSDEAEAIAAITELIANRFGEDE